ncbi:FAD-dependent oxidoreductase [Pseudodesulfovibrio tunisiensis]|uniref:FAD-dependent oxidoreductase n=1 Tax=Pseudodesulfovibrio tunisiensis TaxID=463192 RepID=UPI001FB46239|nr:FAD-dependent oxidoreductase [Pseudodesulfovibrio tunisiensis]
MTGGRLYAHSLERIIPGFAEEAPVERCVVHEKISFMNEGSCTTMDHTNVASEDPAERSYTVLRSKFDPWLAEKAEDEGANYIPGIRVDDLIMRDGKVCGVVAGEDELEADVVVLADGVNSLLGQKAGLVNKLSPHHCAVGVKEIIKLSRQQINDRFGCTDKEGAAWLLAGSPSDNQMGGGFLYTNEESISLGLVFGLHNISSVTKSIPQMLEDFKHHPMIAPLIEGGELLEYSAHVVPEGGRAMVPKMVADGVLIAGDAAGLCLNVGYTVRGMDLAIASGEAAAQAVIKAKEAGNFNSDSLSAYTKLLQDSFVMKDLDLYSNTPEFLDNSRMYNEYPDMVNSMMHDLFTVKGQSTPVRKSFLGHLRKAGIMNLLKDGWKGVRAI